MNAYEKKQAILVTEFDRSVMEHPEFALQITPGAQIVILVEGDELFDDWARRLAGAQREEGQPVVYFQVKGLKPLHSRFEGPVIQKIA